MAAWMFYKDSLCPGCAQDMSLVTDPFVTWMIEDIVCYGCWSKDHRQTEMQKAAEKNPDALAGVKVFVKGPKLKGVSDGD